MIRSNKGRHVMRMAFLMAGLCTAFSLPAAEVAGVKVAESLRIGEQTLLLNGAGLRSKLFIKVYVGALYVEQRMSTPAAIFDSTGRRRVELRLLRDLDAESLHSALNDGLENNHSAAELIAMKPATDALAGIMRRIGKVVEGDIVAIDFSADGVRIALNGEERGKIADVGFARALLKVWLGDKQADASLKNALLGK